MPLELFVALSRGEVSLAKALPKASLAPPAGKSFNTCVVTEPLLRPQANTNNTYSNLFHIAATLVLTSTEQIVCGRRLLDALTSAVSVKSRSFLVVLAPKPATL